MTDWQPHAPDAVLLSDDAGTTVLALKAHPDDADQRCVVLVWQGSRQASIAGRPASLHRLYAQGLQDVYGVGVVRQSERAAELQALSGAELVHHVVVLAGGTVEVVAALLSVERIAGSTAEAAKTALAPTPNSL